MVGEGRGRPFAAGLRGVHRPGGRDAGRVGAAGAPEHADPSRARRRRAERGLLGGGAAGRGAEIDVARAGLRRRGPHTGRAVRTCLLRSAGERGRAIAVARTREKTFAYAEDLRAPEDRRHLVETRVLLKTHEDWLSLPYLWNEEGTVATLSVGGTIKPLSFVRGDGTAISLSYLVPNKNQCIKCHEDLARTELIGPKARNRNRDFAYGDGTENQLALALDIEKGGGTDGAREPRQPHRQGRHVEIDVHPARGDVVGGERHRPVEALDPGLVLAREGRRHRLDAGLRRQNLQREAP